MSGERVWQFPEIGCYDNLCGRTTVVLLVVVGVVVALVVVVTVVTEVGRRKAKSWALVESV